MKRALSLCALALSFAAMTACALSDRSAPKRVVWVFFKDAAARSSARPAVSDYTITQRARLGIGPFPNDAPIPQALIDEVERTGAHVREQSRWLRAVSVEASPRVLGRILRLRDVARIRDVGQLDKAGFASGGTLAADRREAEPARAASANVANAGTDASRTHIGIRSAGFMHAADSAFYGPNYPGLVALGVPPAHQAGFDGSGVRIAIFDTGFQPAHPALSTRHVFAQRDFINHDNIVSDQSSDSLGENQEEHGTAVWSILGGFSPGDVIGPAYNADFILAKVDEEPGDTKVDEDRWVAAVEWADSLDARIINSSVAFRFRFVNGDTLPYDSLNGDSFIVTKVADQAAQRGILVVQAMGDVQTTNLGTLAAPADADSVISVGAVDRSFNPAKFAQFFTARGPTSDGRTKPELVALGTLLRAAESKGQCCFTTVSGTSFSAALIAGAAAMFMQAWPSITMMGVRRALQLAGNTATHPDNTLGWGTPNIGAAILFPEGIALNTLDPSDLTGAVTSVAPAFSWSAPLTNSQMRPILYRVQVATDTGFTNIVFTDTAREAFSLTASRALPPSQHMYWRVVATTQVGVTRASLPQQFRVPDWVRLITFTGDQPTFSPTTQPELAWIPLEPRSVGPFTYTVQILANGTNEIVQNIPNLTSSTLRVPAPLTANQSFRWRVIVRARTGQVDTVQSIQPFVVSTDEKPPATILYQNFPNPFPSSNVSTATDTHFWFDLAQDGLVQLTVHDLRGNLIRNLIPARGCAPVTLSAGIYGRTGDVVAGDPCVLLHWDGTNNNGTLVVPGVYVVQLQAAGVVLRKRMLLTPNRQVP